MSRTTQNTFEQARAYREAVEPVWTEPVFEVVREVLAKPTSATVLVAEARCGYIPLQLLDMLGAQTRIIALDGHDAMLDTARKRVEGLDSTRRIFFVDQRVGHIHYADGVFGAALCLDGVCTLRQAEEALGELARVSAAGARVVLGVPLGDGFPEFYDILDEALRAHDLLDDAQPRLARLRHALIDPARLAQLATRAGLVDVEVEHLSWPIAFAGGHEFLQSPLVRETFFPHWLGLISSSDREPIMRYIGDAIDTYWHARTFSTTIQAALLTATRAATA